MKDISIVPQPAEVQLQDGALQLADPAGIIVVNATPEVHAVAKLVASDLQAETGMAWPVHAAGDPAGRVELRISDEPVGRDAYWLDVTPTGVLIQAPTAAGLFYGGQTLRQLLANADTPRELPCLRIVDYARFGWRGLMLDCCRHFVGPARIKRTIDLLAYHKLNVLHWHLTEDQGWRIEIKQHPRLTEVGAWREADGQRYGGFYTQDEIRDIVAYAAARHVTIVPEIEMPGHCLAAVAAYPELSCTGGPHAVSPYWGIFEDVFCAGSDATFVFLEDVLREVMELFPSEFIHVGGDEVPKTRWATCPKCQARMNAEGLRGTDELQSYFTRRVERFLNRHGRRLIGWDEILEGGLAPHATVQSWRGMDGAIAATSMGHDVVVSPTAHCYVNTGQVRMPGEPRWMGCVTLAQSYAFDPTPAELTPPQAEHVLGLEGAMWTEYAPPTRLDWQIFPRLCALAEVAWTPAAQRDYARFLQRMGRHYRRLDALDVGYFVAPPDASPGELAFEDRVDVTLDNPLGVGEIRYSTDGTAPTTTYARPIHLTQRTTLRLQTVLPSGRASRVRTVTYRQLVPHAPVTPPRTAAGVRCTVYEGRWRELPDLDPLTPVARAVTPVFDARARRRDREYVLKFDGLVQATAAGRHWFYVDADDACCLWIGEELLVEFDGMPNAGEQSGIVILNPGLHPIRVIYLHTRRPPRFGVSYAGPGIERQEIPAAVLAHAR